MNPYNSFASVYDVLNTETDYRAMAEHIAKIFRSAGVEDGALVLDLGCGTGTLTRELCRLGYDMTAVDSSDGMLSLAREKCPEGVLFLCQDITGFELYGTVSAAVCSMDTLNHLTDPGDLARTLDLLHNYIEPDGVLVFDVNSPYKFGKVYGNCDYILEDEGVMLTWQNDYRPEEKIADFYISVFRENGDGLWERSDADFSERCYTLEELRELLCRAGFELLSVTDSYSDREIGADTQRYCISARRI